MSYRRYTAYNAIGAFLWGAGLTLFGWLLGFIPPVASFVENYIDVILILAVLVTVVPALIHYLLGLRKARRLARAAAAGDEHPDAEPQDATGVTAPKHAAE